MMEPDAVVIELRGDGRWHAEIGFRGGSCQRLEAASWDEIAERIRALLPKPAPPAAEPAPRKRKT